MSKPPRRSRTVPPSHEPLAAQDAGLPWSPDDRGRDGASIVAEFTAELVLPRPAGGLDLLAYLLDMARLEAIRVVQRSRKDV